MPDTQPQSQNTLIAVLNEQFRAVKESLSRMESKIDEQAEANNRRDIAFLEYKATTDLQLQGQRADVERRLVDIEKQLAGYKRTILWLMGGVSTVVVSLVIGVLKSTFHW